MGSVSGSDSDSESESESESDRLMRSFGVDERFARSLKSWIAGREAPREDQRCDQQEVAHQSIVLRRFGSREHVGDVTRWTSRSAESESGAEEAHPPKKTSLRHV